MRTEQQIAAAKAGGVRTERRVTGRTATPKAAGAGAVRPGVWESLRRSLSARAC